MNTLSIPFQHKHVVGTRRVWVPQFGGGFAADRLVIFTTLQLDSEHPDFDGAEVNAMIEDHWAWTKEPDAIHYDGYDFAYVTETEAAAMLVAAYLKGPTKLAAPATSDPA